MTNKNVAFVWIFGIMTLMSLSLNLLDNFLKLRTIHPFIGGFDILIFVYALFMVFIINKSAHRFFKYALLIFVTATIAVDILFFIYTFTSAHAIPKFTENFGMAFGLAMKYFYSSSLGNAIFILLMCMNLTCSTLSFLSVGAMSGKKS